MSPFKREREVKTPFTGAEGSTWEAKKGGWEVRKIRVIPAPKVMNRYFLLSRKIKNCAPPKENGHWSPRLQGLD